MIYIPKKQCKTNIYIPKVIVVFPLERKESYSSIPVIAYSFVFLNFTR